MRGDHNWIVNKSIEFTEIVVMPFMTKVHYNNKKFLQIKYFTFNLKDPPWNSKINWILRIQDQINICYMKAWNLNENLWSR